MSSTNDITTAAWRTLVTNAAPGVGRLAEQRSEAASTFAALGFPGRKHEDWRYVDLAPLTARSFALARSGAAPTADVPSLGEESARVVLRNGFVDASSSRLATASGVRIRPLSEGLENPAVLAALDANPYTSNDGVSALQRALAGEGTWIEIAVDAEPAAPIHIVHVVDDAAEATLDAHLLVVTAGRFSQARIVETWVGGGANSATLDSSAVYVDAGAHLEHVLVQNLAPGATWLHRGVLVQERDSRVFHSAFSMGAQLGRDAFEVEQRGSGAETTLNALYVARAGQLLDHHTVVNHAVPNGQSNQLYKGIIDGNGRGVFNGRIYVRPGAQQTNAQQLNRNLLLSPEARIDAKPQLEIFADDVKCSHGATVGQLDREELFYLTSRAISPAQARRMLIDGFAREVAERVPCAVTRQYLFEMLDVSLGGGEQ
jgi:Fe-S cluster assembly protein SufD